MIRPLHFAKTTDADHFPRFPDASRQMRVEVPQPHKPYRSVEQQSLHSAFPIPAAYSHGPLRSCVPRYGRSRVRVQSCSFPKYWHHPVPGVADRVQQAVRRFSDGYPAGSFAGSERSNPDRPLWLATKSAGVLLRPVDRSFRPSAWKACSVAYRETGSQTIAKRLIHRWIPSPLCSHTDENR